MDNYNNNNDETNPNLHHSSFTTLSSAQQLLPQQIHHEEEEKCQEHQLDQEEDGQVMGGMASSIVIPQPMQSTNMDNNNNNNNNNNTNNSTNNSTNNLNYHSSITSSSSSSQNNQYSDPGMIATQEQQKQQQQSSALGIPNHQHNITIDAEDIKKELANGDYIGEDAVKNGSSAGGKGSNAISSFIQKTANAIEQSQLAHSKAMEAHVVEQQRENDRKYRGYPLKDSGVEANANLNTPFTPEPRTGGKYLVTKLRSWRTGYERILSFHQTYFTTLDPETNEITNMWKYIHVNSYSSLPNESECMLIEVSDEYGRGSTKLKFKCLPHNLHSVITSFASCHYNNEVNLLFHNSNTPTTNNNSNKRTGPPSTISHQYQNIQQRRQQIQHQNPVFECLRIKKNRTQSHTLLACAPHGLIEIDAKKRQKTIQTYLYKNIRGVSFVSDDGNAIVFYMGDANTIPMTSTYTAKRYDNDDGDVNIDSIASNDDERICVEKVFHITSKTKIQGSERSQLVTLLKNKFQLLGLSLMIIESVKLHTLMKQKMQRSSKNTVGEIVGTFNVTKFSQRRECSLEIKNDNDSIRKNGHVIRNLMMTQYGYLLECDDDGNDDYSSTVINCRKLKDIVRLVRHDFDNIEKVSNEMNEEKSFSIEFKDGSISTYFSAECDVIVVSILDITVNQCRNFNLTVSDVASLGYHLSSVEMPMSGRNSRANETGIFQLDALEVLCLRRVQNVASTTKSFLGALLYSSDGKVKNTTDICFALVEACREFNVNVLLLGIRNLPNDETLIISTMHDLWAVVSHLLYFGQHFNKDNSSSQHQNDEKKSSTDNGVDFILCVLFQSLYRLMLTPIGYNQTTEVQDAMNVMSTKLSCIDNELTLYWSLKCVSALLLPRPFTAERKIEQESSNKRIVLKKIPNLANFLVNSKICDSELLLMVVGNILESVLCSHRDTTSDEDYSVLLDELSKGYRILMSLLQSKASIIVENTAVLLHILTLQSVDVAPRIKEIALGSGILLQHFYGAIFSVLQGQRFMNRLLCTIWFSGPSDGSQKLLLKRIIPAGFLPYLSMPILSEEEENQLDKIDQAKLKEREKDQHDMYLRSSFLGAGTNISRLRQRVRKSTNNDERGNLRKAENFRIFFHVLEEDHALPDLIWNANTRHDLKIAIKREISSIQEETMTLGGFGKVAWNHQQFKVTYKCLEDEVRVGSIYMRLWLEIGDSFIKSWHDPVRLFEQLFRAILCHFEQNHLITNICIRSLERLYSINAARIGTFPDIMVIVRMMKETLCCETRYRLLCLIASALGCSSDEEVGTESNHWIENVEQVLNDEFIAYTCHVISYCHFDSNETTVDNENASERKLGKCPASSAGIWLISPPGDNPPQRQGILGPFQPIELKHLRKQKTLFSESLVTVIDNDEHEDFVGNDTWKDHSIQRKWTQLNEFVHLKWYLLSDQAYSSSFELTSIALQCLNRMVSVNKSVDERGIPFFPLPIVKELICKDRVSTSEPNPLRTICQSLLSNETHIVEESVTLIMNLIKYNDDASAKLYQSGLFYFIFLLNESNFATVAKLVEVTHTNQAYLKISKGDSSMESSSILKNVLPQGLLNVFTKKGWKTFIEIFSKGCDTPDVIWSRKMKAYLTSTIQQYLRKFLDRIKSKSTETYRYIPLPQVEYENLNGELFCHGYYLRNLCNEDKFPEWPISEPIELFHACQEVWNGIALKHKRTWNISLEEARLLMGLNISDNAIDLKDAYVKLVNKLSVQEVPNRKKINEAISAFHCLDDYFKHHQEIEKLPFEEIEVPNDDCDIFGMELEHQQSISLLLKAQLMICKRYPNDLEHYKYPSYILLLSCLNITCIEDLELDSQSILQSPLLQENRCNLIRTSVELIFNTCLVSPQNADELVKEQGLIVLDSMLHIYITALHILTNLDSKVVESKRQTIIIITEILIHIVHTISGMSYFDSVRSAILSLDNPQRLCKNWRKCVDLRFLGFAPIGCNMLKRYALEGIASFSKNAELQKMLVGAHIIWPLLNSMLGYDPTLATSHMVSEEFTDVLSPPEINFQAFLATRAIGMLCGVMNIDDLSTPNNGILCSAMKKLLTPPLAKMLSNSQSGDLLQTLNLNVASAVRLWDENMRAELDSFVKNNDHATQEQYCQNEEEALIMCDDFEYSNLSNEVNIGGVYIRIFNKMEIRNAIRDLTDVSYFADSLLDFVGRSIQNSDVSKSYPDNRIINVDMDQDTHWLSVSDSRFFMAVRSILHLVQLDGIVDDIMCQKKNVDILFCLLYLPDTNQACQDGHDILLLMSPKKGFADATANLTRILRRLLTNIEFFDDESNCSHVVKEWSILESLTSTTSVAKTFVESSAWVELLGVVVGYSKFSNTKIGRQGAAKTLFRLVWDPSINSISVPLLQKFLPEALLCVLRDKGPDEMLHVLENDCEQPELVWNSSLKNELLLSITEQLDCLFSDCSPESLEPFALDSMFSIKFNGLENELYIGGVYVRLFMKNPSYPLKDPVGFFERLMAFWAQLMQSIVETNETIENQKNDDKMKEITGAFSHLCGHSYLCVKLAPWGYMKRAIVFIHNLTTKTSYQYFLLSAITLLHAASHARVNVEGILDTCDADGKHGIVDGIMKSIGTSKLHPNTSFMLETLKNIALNTLGDVSLQLPTTSLESTENWQQRSVVGIDPSPAPGTEPVKNMEKLAGGDPLSMLLGNEGPTQTKHGVNTVRNRNTTARKSVHNINRKNASTTQPPFQMNPKRSHMDTTSVSSRSERDKSTSYLVNHNRPGMLLQHGDTGPQNINNTTHQSTKTNMNTGNRSNAHSHYKHPLPVGRGVKPLRNDGGNHKLSIPASTVNNNNVNSISTVRPHERNQQVPSLHVVNSNTQYSTQLMGPTKTRAQHLITNTNNIRSPNLITQHHNSVVQHHNNFAQNHHIVGQHHNNFAQNHNNNSLNQGLPPVGHNTVHFDSRHHGTNVQYNQANSQAVQNQEQLHLATHQLQNHHQQQIAHGPTQPNLYQHQPLYQSHASHIDAVHQANRINHTDSVIAKPVVDPKKVAKEKMKSIDGAPNCAKGRKIFLDSVLSCGLIPFLVDNILEHPSRQDILDEDATKLHVIEIIDLLSKDPGYGLMFHIILDALPNWSKYKK